MSDEGWLSPTNKILWMQAFRARAKTCKLKDGREFTIRYDDERAYVKPKKGFVPTGNFLLKKVTDEIWLTETDRVSEALPKGESPYSAMMRNFVTSDEKGVDVVKHWPQLVSRNIATLRLGFMHAKTLVGAPASNVEVINQAGHIYLIKE